MEEREEKKACDSSSRLASERKGRVVDSHALLLRRLSPSFTHRLLYPLHFCVILDVFSMSSCLDEGMNP